MSSGDTSSHVAGAMESAAQSVSTAVKAHGGLFVAQADGAFMPTLHSRGPWSLDALHGGPPAALLARAIERCDPRPDMQVARLSVELIRPVPASPLRVEARVTRPGRRVQLIDATARSDELTVAYARALRIQTGSPPIRLSPSQGAGGISPEAESLRGPDGIQPMVFPESTEPAFHSAGAELRFEKGAFHVKGPATVWVRLLGPVVAGEVPSPLQRVAAAADFGNGVSAELTFGTDIFINPDLTIHLHRMPVGEWVCLDARTWLGDPGIGMAESSLFDVAGPIGRSLQSLLVQEGR